MGKPDSEDASLFAYRGLGGPYHPIGMSELMMIMPQRTVRPFNYWHSQTTVAQPPLPSGKSEVERRSRGGKRCSEGNGRPPELLMGTDAWLALAAGAGSAGASGAGLGVAAAGPTRRPRRGRNLFAHGSRST